MWEHPWSGGRVHNRGSVFGYLKVTWCNPCNTAKPMVEGHFDYCLWFVYKKSLIREEVIQRIECSTIPISISINSNITSHTHAQAEEHQRLQSTISLSCMSQQKWSRFMFSYNDFQEQLLRCSTTFCSEVSEVYKQQWLPVGCIGLHRAASKENSSNNSFTENPCWINAPIPTCWKVRIVTCN